MIPCMLYVGTEDGVFVLRLNDDDKLELVGRGLEGNAVRGIAIHPNDPQTAYVACGLRGWGLHRTKNSGHTFELMGFKDRWVWDVILKLDNPNTLWVGTEPPMLYVSNDDGLSFTPISEIEKLPSRYNWTFFHSPFFAGHIHGMALHPKKPERLFAGVEQGALLYTHDGGITWKDTLLEHDVHRISIDPQDPDKILAGTAEGLFISKDAGESWVPILALSGKYVHSIVFDPQQTKTLYVYAYEKDSPIYKSQNGGISWEKIGCGLPDSKESDTLCLHPIDSKILFYAGDIDSGSRIFVSLDEGNNWNPLPYTLPKIWRLRTTKDFAMA